MLLQMPTSPQRHPNPNIHNIGCHSMSMGSNVHEQEALSLLCIILPRLSINRVRVVPNRGIQQMYSVDIAGERGPVLFTTTHPSWVKPLRSEYSSISSEAILWAWYSVLSAPVRFPQETDHNGQIDGHTDRANPTHYSRSTKLYLSGFLPTLVKYSLPIPEAQVPEYIISHPRPGNTVSSLAQILDKDDYESIHWQSGQLLRRIACHVSPTGRFGDITSVMRPLSILPMRPLAQSPANAPYIFGSSSWSAAFHLMLESVLRDLEDRFVNIAYARVRRNFSRLRHLLDNVTRPSLVAIECNDMENLLVDSNADDPGPVHQDPKYSTRPNIPNIPKAPDKYKVTGLRNWSVLVFGDPLIATVFTDKPPQSFMSGLHQPIPKDDPFESNSIIEHRESAPIRLLLYNCYHALTDLAKEYYHVRQGDDELEARRRLMIVLNKLEDISDEEDYMEKLRENSSVDEARIDADAVGTNKKFGVAS